MTQTKCNPTASAGWLAAVLAGPHFVGLRVKMVSIGCCLLCAALGAGAAVGQDAPFRFRVEQIEAGLGIGYAVHIADVNEDARPDIVVLDKDRILWYQNPEWQQHTLLSGQSLPDNVSLASHDIDRDGHLDFALAAEWKPFETRGGGTIGWLSRVEGKIDQWQLYPIATEPTVHRIRFANVDADDEPELIVVPLMGRDTAGPEWNQHPVRILAFDLPADPRKDTWPMTVLNEALHVTHNFFPCDLNEDQATDILVASFEGVSWLNAVDGQWQLTHLGDGNQLTMPNRGASEIKLGTLAGGQKYIATIEPWHGFQVVIYLEPNGTAPGERATAPWTRHVIDEQLQWGHAVWCANMDADEDEELIIGIRDNKSDLARHGVRVYDPRPVPEGEPAAWPRYAVDAGGVAVEDLTVADLDGDGRKDIVAVGRASKNARIYWNLPPL